MGVPLFERSREPGGATSHSRPAVERPHPQPPKHLGDLREGPRKGPALGHRRTPAPPAERYRLRDSVNPSATVSITLSIRSSAATCSLNARIAAGAPVAS